MIVPATRITDVINCTVISAFLNSMPLLVFLKTPFNTFTGWYPDNTNAGYIPARKLPIKNNSRKAENEHKSEEHGFGVSRVIPRLRTNFLADSYYITSNQEHIKDSAWAITDLCDSQQNSTRHDNGENFQGSYQ